MKKEWIMMCLSFAGFFLGIVLLCLFAWNHSLLSNLKSGFFILDLIITIICYISYRIHYKNYMHIKALKQRKKVVLAYWIYKPNTSEAINEAILSEKISSFYTLILVCIVGILLGVGFSLVHIPFFSLLAKIIYALSFLVFIFGYWLLIKHYSNKLSTISEAIIGDDSFYFLDKLYTFQKNMYILSQVSLNTEAENCLSFTYGFCGDTVKSTYTINIPVPPGQMEIARYICVHYENII